MWLLFKQNSSENTEIHKTKPEAGIYHKAFSCKHFFSLSQTPEITLMIIEEKFNSTSALYFRVPLSERLQLVSEIYPFKWSVSIYQYKDGIWFYHLALRKVIFWEPCMPAVI